MAATASALTGPLPHPAQRDGFLTFTPDDNDDLASASAREAGELITADLGSLLHLPPARFWAVVLSDASLRDCLDSFLRFRRRCYDDFSDEDEQGSSDTLLQMSQRVFRVYWRLLHPHELQRTAASGADSSGSGSTPRTRSEAAEQLRAAGLLDAPKLLDLAALYAPGSPALTGQLLRNALALLPTLAVDVAQLADAIAGNLTALCRQLEQLCGQALSLPPAAPARIALMVELAEAALYLRDTACTLHALACCLPEAASLLLLAPASNGALLLALSLVHGSALPLLQRVAAQPGVAPAGLAAPALARLEACLVSTVAALVRAAFCTREGAAASGGPNAAAAAAAAAFDRDSIGGSSSSGSSSIGREPSLPSFSVELQGERLVSLLMLLAHPADHMAPELLDAGPMRTGLLQDVTRVHALDAAIAAAMHQGLLSLDDAQLDYTLALLGGDRALLDPAARQQAAAAAASATTASTTTTGPAGSKQNKTTTTTGRSDSSGSATVNLVPPSAQAQVADLRELLPEYGDGFLTAALHYSNWSSEAAVNCLLEGQLPAALAALDPSLSTWTPPQPPAGMMPSWTDAAAAAAATARALHMHPPELPSAAARAHMVPRPGVDRRTGRVLQALEGHVRATTKAMAAELQYEYDDEYDDSFDDLVGPGADGVADAEGEDGSERGAQDQGRGVAQPPPAQAGRGRGPARERLWVLDGRVYAYPKPGAQEVAGRAGAEAALQEAAIAAQQIHGLGPGGNVPLPAAPPPAQQQQQQAQTQRSRGEAHRGGGRGGGGTNASPAVPGGSGRGRGYAHKEAHKSAVANHHRKDRALSKQSRGML